MIGQTLGPYRVLEKLGEGGMGEVYRARDTQLKRDIALKVLPADVSTDTDRLTRFQREAELLAALNHPHIAQIYGLAETASAPGTAETGLPQRVTRALVMELVEGPTLAERIARGAVPVAEALPIALQLAEALEYAHEHGIIHRDLKPANVKVTSDGAVKVLDFGLAKALDAESGGTRLQDSPTMTSPAMTMAGVILGTAAYISPEQARGAVVDKRADIWAFGVVLFEMLTGRTCFAGETVTDVLAAIVRAEPDWTALPPDTPARVRDLLKRCLAKDRRQRLHDIGDARLEIEAALGTVEEAGPSSTVVAMPAGRRARMSTREKIAWGLAGLGLLLFVLAISLRVARTPATGSVGARPLRYTFNLPPGVTLLSPNTPALAVSPDGTRLVLAAAGGDRIQLYTRAVGELELQAIPGTQGATMPFFSSDGTWVGYEDEGTLRKIPVSGGTPTTICFGGDVRGASWGADGWIVFTRAMRSGLWRVRADGGEPEEVTTLDRAKQEKTHRYPRVLPGARGILFASATGDLTTYDDSTIVAFRRTTREQVAVLKGGMVPHYVESGHIVFARAGAIFAVPFDIDRLAVTGREAKVISGVRTDPSTGVAEFSVSPNGTLAYAAGGPVGEDGRMIVLDREGIERSLVEVPGPYTFVRLSPNGRSIAVELTKANEELWIFDLDRGSSTRFAAGWDNLQPVWTPDGQRLVFISNRLGTSLLFIAPVDGSWPARPLTGGEDYGYPFDVSPDGRTLVYQRIPETGRELWRLSLEGESNPRPILKGPGNYWDARFSPDGRWLAYDSDESGRDEIYVRPFPGPGGRQLVSAGGGYGPRWTRGGREIIYEAYDGTIMSVAITPGSPLRSSRPQPLWQGRPTSAATSFGRALGFRAYDVSADGERFVFSVSGPSGERPREVTVITNWLEELKQLAPPAR